MAETKQELLDKIEKLSKEKEQLEEQQALIIGTHHDIKIGLASVGGFARNLFKTEEDNRKKQILRIIIGESSRYENLIRDLKKLMDIESGQEELSIDYDTSLLTCIDPIIEKYELIANQNFSFENQVDASYRVGMNDGLVKSIYDNLIGNTIKFNEDSNITKPIMVAIGAKDIGDFIEGHYWDNGTGIQEDKRSRVFELNFRGDHRIAGSGIGLHYIKTLVEGHGGKIILNSNTDLSTSDGHYTEFIFTLPKPQSYSD